MISEIKVQNPDPGVHYNSPIKAVHNTNEAHMMLLRLNLLGALHIFKLTFNNQKIKLVVSISEKYFLVILSKDDCRTVSVNEYDISFKFFSRRTWKEVNV